MTEDELELKMREVLAKSGKPQAAIERVVPFLLNQSYLQTDETRLLFFKQWENSELLK